ncbi:enoyl-CoA hydratase/isomerase family protein [Paraburkholderia sp. J67]|uniref:enoyl-CoA hydratase/isomerase family protein n=1 Tax=Paraburkholderia sp. J67 TaxID=2805435 RepID=UPI002ABE2576|nr:enoyl-CoA hydratase/isomerase family protein [Paraburkholderia sp. J67]
MEFNTLLVDIKDKIALVTLNRPEKRNAQNAEMRNEIIDCFDILGARDDVSVIIITGAGSVFSAGADISDRKDLSQPGAFPKHHRVVRESAYAIRECPKPIIAAINGAAMGAGFGIVMNSDIWVASEEAYVSMPEINVGLAGGVSFLNRIFGQSRARRMFYTGMKVTGLELYRLGLVEACTTQAELLPFAMEIAKEMTSKSPVALRLAKEAARLTENMPLREAYRYEQGNTEFLSKTEDSKEAQRAFLEKRAPVYTGR